MTMSYSEIMNKAARHCLSQFFGELIINILTTMKNTTQNFHSHKHTQNKEISYL